jgi:hypothetical protein
MAQRNTLILSLSKDARGRSKSPVMHCGND